MKQREVGYKISLPAYLKKVEAALATIESHPEVQQVIDALAKLHWLR